MAVLETQTAKEMLLDNDLVLLENQMNWLQELRLVSYIHLALAIVEDLMASHSAKRIAHDHHQSD